MIILNHLFAGVDDSTTIAQFLSLLEEMTHVPAASIELLSGFPPKLIEFPSDHSTPFSSLGIQSGEILTVQQGSSARVDNGTTANSTAAADVETTDHTAFSIPDMVRTAIILFLYFNTNSHSLTH